MRKISLYFKEMRAPFFTATIIPIFLGSVMGWYHQGMFNWWLFLLTILGGVFLHAGVNITNDYYDHISGTDPNNMEFSSPFTGGSRMIQKGLLTPKEVLIEGLLFYAVGSLTGVYLVFQCGLAILWIGLIGVVTSFFYTAPPFKFVYRGIGEIFIGLNFGPLMTLGAYYVQARNLSWKPVVASIPVALLITAVLYINEFQDYKADISAGKLHWVARIGRANGSVGYGLFLLVTYLSIGVGILSRALPIWSLAAFSTLPIAIKAYRVARTNYDNVAQLTPANAMTIQLHLIIGIILSVVFLIP